MTFNMSQSERCACLLGTATHHTFQTSLPGAVVFVSTDDTYGDRRSAQPASPDKTFPRKEQSEHARRSIQPQQASQRQDSDLDTLPPPTPAVSPLLGATDNQAFSALAIATARASEALLGVGAHITVGSGSHGSTGSCWPLRQKAGFGV